jgi:hypothetical protein
VLIAHDFSVVSALAYYPEELNGWMASGWKQQTVWNFADAANPVFVFSPTMTYICFSFRDACADDASQERDSLNIEDGGRKIVLLFYNLFNYSSIIEVLWISMHMFASTRHWALANS